VFVITAPKTAGDQANEELERKQADTRKFRRRRLKVGLGIFGIIALGFALFITFQLDEDANYEAAFAQAEQAIAEGNLEGARVVYRDILQRDPANKFAHFNLGMLAHMQGRGPEAEDFYRRALRTDPTFLAALFNLAILQEALGRDQEAAQTYREILAEYPDDAASHFNYGSLLIRKLGETEEGQSQIERAVELDSSLSARVSPGPPDPGDPVASPQSEE
jgi:tetratricopeptide (TPR) repeat protein